MMWKKPEGKGANVSSTNGRCHGNVQRLSFVIKAIPQHRQGDTNIHLFRDHHGKACIIVPKQEGTSKVEKEKSKYNCFIPETKTKPIFGSSSTLRVVSKMAHILICLR